MRGRDIKDFDRGIIYGLSFHAHWTSRQISNATGISLSAVTKFCQRNEANALFDLHQQSQRKVCGRRRITTKNFDRRVRNFSKHNRFSTAKTIARNFQNEFNVSHDTINRRLNERGIKARKPAIKPHLTDRHKLNRLTWAQNNEERDWDTVAFSDEKTFVISGLNHQYVR